MRVILACAALALTSCESSTPTPAEIREDPEVRLVLKQNSTHVYRKCDGTTAVYLARNSGGDVGGVATVQNSTNCAGVFVDDPKAEAE
jgi:hypothetical protein